MPITLHTHSGQFCCHATGKLEDVVLAAIEKGFVCIGLSEHIFRTRTQDLYPEEIEMNVDCQKLKEIWINFVKEARRLQKKYSDKINILVGTETENIHKGTIQEIKDIIKEYPLDYMVGSVHHVYEIPTDFDNEMFNDALTKSPEKTPDSLYQSYFDLQYDIITQLQPKIIGHFDVIRMFTPEAKLSDKTWEKIKRNVNAVNAYGGIFEINSRAWKKGLEFAYPFKDILQYIISKDSKITLGDDSHDPAQVGLHYDKLYNYLKEMNIKKVYYLERNAESSEIIEKTINNIQDKSFWKFLENSN